MAVLPAFSPSHRMQNGVTLLASWHVRKKIGLPFCLLRADHLQDNGASVVDSAVREQASDKASSSTQDSMAAADTATTSGAGFDMVAAAEWPELPADVVLLSPSQCRTLWRQFSSDSMYAVRQVSILPMLRLSQTQSRQGSRWYGFAVVCISINIFTTHFPAPCFFRMLAALARRLGRD